VVFAVKNPFLYRSKKATSFEVAFYFENLYRLFS